MMNGSMKSYKASWVNQVISPRIDPTRAAALVPLEPTSVRQNAARTGSSSRPSSFETPALVGAPAEATVSLATST
jgi:hypothetical protein